MSFCPICVRFLTPRQGGHHKHKSVLIGKPPVKVTKKKAQKKAK